MNYYLDRHIEGYKNPQVTEEFARKNLYPNVHKSVLGSMTVLMLGSISMFQTNSMSCGRFYFSDYHFMISNHPFPKMYINNKEYMPNKGLLAFNPDTEAYADRTVKCNYYLGMRVDRDFLADVARQMNIEPPLRFRDASNYFSPEFNNILSGAISEICSGRNCKLMLDSYSVQIAAMLLRAMKNDKIKEYDRFTKPGYIDKAIDYMRENLSTNISIEQICANVHISQYHFLREFKKSTGLTPHLYLMRMRLEKAELLLKSKDLPITQIAMDCGFCSPAHFSFAFKNQFGVSPSDFSGKNINF